jgi:exonuclease III
VRHVVPPSERLYTWWSYRAQDWSASNRGRRLDHIWVTPNLVPGVLSIEGDARGARLATAVGSCSGHGRFRRPGIIAALAG